MNTTGKKLLKQLSLELEEQELSIKERKHYGTLKQQVKYLAVGMIGLALVSIAQATAPETSPIEKVSEPLPLLDTCPNMLTTTLNGAPFCAIT